MLNSILIGVTGYLNSGKDTFADVGVHEFGFQKMYFAGPLKQGVASFFGWSMEMMENRVLKEQVDPYWGVSPREVLQWMGTEVMREFFPRYFLKIKDQIGADFWIRRFEKDYLSNPRPAIVPDVRFQNEVDLITRLGGKLVIIHRPSVVPTQITHASENISSLKGNFTVILNEGTLEEFKEKCRFFFKEQIVC